MHDQAGSHPTEQGAPARREVRTAWLATRLPTWIAVILVVVWAYQLRYGVAGGMYL